MTFEHTAASEEPNRRGITLARCLGMGCFLSVIPSGSLDTCFLAAVMPNASLVLLAQVVQLAATGAFGMALWLCSRRGMRFPRPAVLRACNVVFGACLVGYLLAVQTGPHPAAVAAISLVLGGASVYLLFWWFDMLLGVCRAQGRTRCTVLLAACWAVSVSLAVPAPFVAERPVAALVVSLCAVAVAQACQEYLGRRPLEEAPPAEAAPGPSTAKRRQGLSIHAVALLVSFGIMIGITRYFSLFDFSGAENRSSFTLSLAIAAACLVTAGCFKLVSLRGSIPFGYIIRISVAAGGTVIAATPLLASFAPALIDLLLRLALLLQSLAMILFSVEISYEAQARITDILPANYAIWAGSASVTMPLTWWFANRVGGHEALDLVAFTAVLAMAVLLPVLPSLSSNASTFTHKVLPENETLEERTMRLKAQLADVHGLTERERSVLDLVVEGKSRQEIGRALNLSGWTIKDHLSDIYAKVGVHSAKELVALVTREER